MGRPTGGTDSSSPMQCLRCIEKECDWCEVNVGLGRCSTCETAKKPCIFGNLRLSGEVLSTYPRRGYADDADPASL